MSDDRPRLPVYLSSARIATATTWAEAERAVAHALTIRGKPVPVWGDHNTSEREGGGTVGCECTGFWFWLTTHDERRR